MNSRYHSSGHQNSRKSSSGHGVNRVFFMRGIQLKSE
jgi:hypothetical protein